MNLVVTLVTMWADKEIHSRHQGMDLFDKDHPLSFYLDVGSIFSLEYDVDDHGELIRQKLNTVMATCQHNWHWTVDEFTVFVADADGLNIMPDGNKARVSDLRRQLWINFASPDDAMLCRLAIDELRSGKHVERGRMSGGS